MEDVNTAWKIAVSMIVICFILSIGLAIMSISKAYLNNTQNTMDTAIANVGHADAYSLANSYEPVPVAAIYRVLQGFVFDSTSADSGVELHVYNESGVEMFSYDAEGNVREGFNGGCTIDVLQSVIGRRGNLSYSEVDSSGAIRMEVHLA